jgi:hypothetical protein
MKERSDLRDTPKRWTAPDAALGYNFASEVMPSSRYALVTYVRNPVGEFVEQLRRNSIPPWLTWPAHLTILPPRELVGNRSGRAGISGRSLQPRHPFDVELGDVETFLPTTPTVFIQVKRAAYRMRELHDQLAARVCAAGELALYSASHDLEDGKDEQARAACWWRRERWAEFPGKRQVQVEELMFVRENGRLLAGCSAAPLGRGQLSSKSHSLTGVLGRNASLLLTQACNSP